MENIFKACFDRISDLQLIVIKGTTPSFNDGDPCTHSDDVNLFTSTKLFSNGGTFECALEMYEEVHDGVENDPGYKQHLLQYANLSDELVIPDSIDLKQIIKNGISSLNGERDIEKAMVILESQNLTQALYYTNYLLVITKDNGQLKVERHDSWSEY